MADCGVCIGTDDYDEQAEFLNVRVVRGRKAYKCAECRGSIDVGQDHHVTSGKCDGTFFSERTCLPCSEIAAKFTCGAVNIGEFWAEMRDYGFAQLTTGCMDGLSATAKEFLLERWRKWKGLDAA